MYSCAFDQMSLSKLVCEADFQEYPNLKLARNRNRILKTAENIAKNGIPKEPLAVSLQAGEKIYNINDPSTSLVLRKAAENINNVLKVKRNERNEIIRRLELLCAEYHEYSLARLCIKNIYEHIDQQALIKCVRARLMTTPSTCFVVESFLQKCLDQKIIGIPNGIVISELLVELFLSDFDRNLVTKLSPYYVARYSEDIVMVLPFEADGSAIIHMVQKLLPPDLKLDNQKCQAIKVPRLKDRGNQTHKFTFLEHEITIGRQAGERNQKKSRREVQINVATGNAKTQ